MVNFHSSNTFILVGHLETKKHIHKNLQISSSSYSIDLSGLTCLKKERKEENVYYEHGKRTESGYKQSFLEDGIGRMMGEQAFLFAF